MKALHRPRYIELSTQLGLRNGDLIIDDEADNMVNVLEFYRAPRCLRCTLRVDFYVEMEIQ
eukprot:6183783-Heterocapsa_arctica.AAC.1